MKFENKQYDEERALYGIKDSEVLNCIFDGPADGESALKECRDIVIDNCFFNLRYPFWHVNNVVIKNSKMTENCRASLWYDDNVTIDHCDMGGIKALRECSNITLKNSNVVSPEFLWRCNNVRIESSTLDSEYPLFECKDVSIDGLKMKGKYSFQYIENMTIKNSVLDTKDAFWHTKNVTVTDSIVKGEYLGWYSENLTLIRCQIIGTQPLCYCKNLVLEDCTMEETDLSFERSEVNATIKGSLLGIKNPMSGKIIVDDIDELLIESEYVNPDDTVIKYKTVKNLIMK